MAILATTAVAGAEVVTGEVGIVTAVVIAAAAAAAAAAVEVEDAVEEVVVVTKYLAV